jgi:hypothetical protein
LGLGVAFALLICLVLWAVTGQAPVLLAFPFLGLLTGLIGLTIGQAIGRRHTAPVQLERYAPSEGTIAVRFRWPDYGDRLLAFMELQEAIPAHASAGRVSLVH